MEKYVELKKIIEEFLELRKEIKKKKNYKINLINILIKIAMVKIAI